MPEKKEETRTLEQIQSEYQGMCLKAGHIQYQIFALSKDLAILNDSLRDLNLEASKLKSEEVKKDE